jgi:hypothetical protein
VITTDSVSRWDEEKALSVPLRVSLNSGLPVKCFLTPKVERHFSAQHGGNTDVVF